MEIVMTKFKEKVQGQVKQAVGQMVGDDQLVLEGKKQQRDSERAANTSEHGRSKGKEQQKDKSLIQNAPKMDVNKPTSEQTGDPTGRKGPVLD
jgi:uncharacterized protein YjbJ (UPF0337 family)